VDDLNIHGRFARLTSALAIDAVLAHQHQRIRDQIERHRQASPLQSHPKFVFFERGLAVVIDRHASTIAPK